MSNTRKENNNMRKLTGKAAILAAAICVAAALPSWAEAKSVTLTCSGYTGTTTLTDFQALVKLSDGVNGFRYADCATNDGTDLWFTDSSGNLIPHEVDTWNTTGDSFVWVKIPTLTPASAGFARITMHWGEARTAEQTCVSKDTWNGFVGVWHMGAASGTAAEPDVTGNGLDAVPTVANGSCNLSQMTANADGVVGGSRVNQTSTGDNNNPGLKVPDYTSKITDRTKFSVGGWFRATGTVSYFPRLLAQTHYASSRRNIQNLWEIHMGTGNPGSVNSIAAVRGSSGTSLAAASIPNLIDQWGYIYVTYNGSTATVYVNGVAAQSGSIAACAASDYGFFIGAMGNYGIGWYGKYDEVRMFNGVQSADRIKADYDTMHNPSSFLTPAVKQVTLSCSGYAGTTTLTGFQALVKLSDGVNGFRYGDCATNDGSDLWFTDSNGNLIPHEVDKWNTSGSSFVWVRIPELKPINEGATTITMHWGEARTAEQTCVTKDTWNGFVGVWHMGEASGTTAEPDVTGNGLDAVPTVAYGSYNLSQMTANADGVVGGSRVNQTSTGDNNTPGLKVPDYTAKITDHSKFSVGGWFRASGTVNYWARMLAQRHYKTARKTIVEGWEVELDTGSSTVLSSVRGGSSTRVANTPIPDIGYGWVYVYVTYNGTTATIYVNGVAANAGSVTACPASDYGFFIGAMGNYGIGWYGKYDEVRMFNGIQSADRIKADYDTMSSPDTFWSESSAAPDPSTVYAATWTGNANDGAVANAANWRCTNSNGDVIDNALPTEDTLVFIEGNNVNVQIPAGQTLAGKMITIRNCTLAADCDWRGLDVDAVLVGTLDLNGRNLHVRRFGGTVTITSTAPVAAEANELRVDLGENDTWNNTSVVLSGSVRLVKEGTGTYVAGKADQSYGGGTEIIAGVLKIGVNGVYHPFGAYNTRVHVATTNAVLDVNGLYNNNNHEFVLNGGVLRNTGANVGGGTGQFKTIRLETNSFFKVSSNWGFIGNGWAATELDLAGHELDMEIPSGHYFFFANTAVSAGRIRVHGYGSGAGYLQTGNANTSSGYAGSRGNNSAINTDFVVEVPLSIYAPLLVHDYIANYSGAVTANGGFAALKVHGTFKPSAHDFYYGCTIMDGATIDLTRRTTALPSVSSFTAGSTNLTFAADATTVKIKLGERSVSSQTPIISWDPTFKPSGIDTVKFVSETGERKRTFVTKDDGLYALSGFMIIVK